MVSLVIYLIRCVCVSSRVWPHISIGQDKEPGPNWPATGHKGGKFKTLIPPALCSKTLGLGWHNEGLWWGTTWHLCQELWRHQVPRDIYVRNCDVIVSRPSYVIFQTVHTSWWRHEFLHNLFIKLRCCRIWCEQVWHAAVRMLDLPRPSATFDKYTT